MKNSRRWSWVKSLFKPTYPAMRRRWFQPNIEALEVRLAPATLVEVSVNYNLSVSASGNGQNDSRSLQDSGSFISAGTTPYATSSGEFRHSGTNSNTASINFAVSASVLPPDGNASASGDASVTYRIDPGPGELL